MSQPPAGQLRVKKGCNTCRQSKVKCNDERPTCGRCSRLARDCTWPTLELSLRAKRRSHGSLKSRQGRWVPPPLARKSVTDSAGDSAGGSIADSRNSEASGSLPNCAPIIDPTFNSDEWWSTMSLDPNMSDWPPLSDSINDDFLSIDQPLSGFGDFAPLSPITSDNNNSYFHGIEASIPRSLPDDHFPLPNSLVLSSREHHAVGHFQSTFSIYRTTKDPKWSTHKLLLDIGAADGMIMHFILAVSINDLSHRREHESSQEAQRHFEAGTQALIKTIERNSPQDHVNLLAAFLFLYLYMPKRKSIPQQRIRQLSMTVRDYVKKHNLDSLCLEPTPYDSSLKASPNLNFRDRCILARFIIWVFDEDVKCGFQGCGGYLADYLTAHRERTMAVYEVSRTVLEAYWGSKYPQSQTDDDNDNAMELEFLWALTALWQDINGLAEGISLNPSTVHRRIEQRFSLLGKKYSSVFQNSAKVTRIRSRILINADYDVVLFNALRVYFFRCTSPDHDIETPPDIQSCLKTMLLIIQQTFVSSNNELHDRLQWPLFLAGIETNDLIYRDWIMSRLTKGRVRGTLEQIIERQTSSGLRLSIVEIRNLLWQRSALAWETSSSEISSLPDPQDWFLGSTTISE